MNETQRNALRTTIKLQEKNLEKAEIELQQAKDILKAREVTVKVYKETIEQLKEGLPPYEPEDGRPEQDTKLYCGFRNQYIKTKEFTEHKKHCKERYT